MPLPQLTKVNRSPKDLSAISISLLVIILTGSASIFLLIFAPTPLRISEHSSPTINKVFDNRHCPAGQGSYKKSRILTSSTLYDGRSAA
jgi:hypothetical protein